MSPPGFGHWRANVPPGPHFHPWGWHPHRFGRFGFGRRLFWFGFGAFAAMAWARHHGMGRLSVEGERERGEWDGGCRRVEYSPRLVPEAERREHWGWGWGHHDWHNRRRDEQPVAPASAPAPPVAQSAPVQVATVQHTPAPPSPPVGTKVIAREQDFEAEILDYTRQASERVTEMSEATIDSLVSGLQGLKSRLAEHRTETQKRIAEEERRR